MQKNIYKKTGLILAATVTVFFSQAFFNLAKATGGLITCGKNSTSMCTLCDIIEGMNTIIQYFMKISIGVALAVFTAAGIMYIVSTGGSKMIELAKSAMKNALIGFIVIFAAYLIVNGIVLRALGTKSDLGISVTGWGTFDCAPTRGANDSTTNTGGATGGY